MVDRKQLDDIIMKNDTNDWWQPELFIKNTKYLLPPELEILADPPLEEQNYNCFLHVLGLYNNPTILQETKGFIYDSFVKHLLDVGELEKTYTPTAGDYVVYQDLENYPDSLTHTGITDGDKVISKWAWGPLVRHSLWDVPAEYGETVFYIKAIGPETSLGLYQEYKKFNVRPS